MKYETRALVFAAVASKLEEAARCADGAFALLSSRQPDDDSRLPSSEEFIVVAAQLRSMARAYRIACSRVGRAAPQGKDASDSAPDSDKQ